MEDQAPYFAHPRNEFGDYVCSKEHPMPDDRPEGSRWQHADAEEIDEDYGPGGGVADGDYVIMRCPHCKLQWREELPN